MQIILENEGHEVASSLSGVRAVSGVRAMQPDCVIIDLMMASLDGLELCDELRKIDELKNTKIVMISARNADHWIEKAKEHGAVGYITKPIDPSCFADDLAELVTNT